MSFANNANDQKATLCGNEGSKDAESSYRLHVVGSLDGWEKTPRAGSGIDAISPVRSAASKDSGVEVLPRLEA
jgi:hypothetical protein